MANKGYLVNYVIAMHSLAWQKLMAVFICASDINFFVDGFCGSCFFFFSNNFYIYFIVVSFKIIFVFLKLSKFLFNFLMWFPSWLRFLNPLHPSISVYFTAGTPVGNMRWTLCSDYPSRQKRPISPAWNCQLWSRISKKHCAERSFELCNFWKM